MPAREFLFVGGSCDGKKIYVDLKKEYCIVSINPHLENGELIYDSEIYRKQLIYGDDKKSEVFLKQDKTPDDLIKMLLEGYKGNAGA